MARSLLNRSLTYGKTFYYYLKPQLSSLQPMSHLSDTQTTTKHYRFLSAFVAFLIWGSWAYFLNHKNDNGTASGLVSGITQGIASFVITLLMVRAVTYVYGKLPNTKWAIAIPAVVTVSITGSCLILIHWLVGTQNISTTVILPLLVAFIFCLFTTYPVSLTQHTIIVNYE